MNLKLATAILIGLQAVVIPTLVSAQAGTPEEGSGVESPPATPESPPLVVEPTAAEVAPPPEAPPAPEATQPPEATPAPEAPPAPEATPEPQRRQATGSPGWSGALQQRPRTGEFDVLGIPIELGGYVWVDTGYLNRNNAQAGQADQIANYMQGRFVLAASFTKTLGDYYGTARVEVMGLVNEFSKSQYEPHTLDAYLLVGHKRWGDVQIGRFLAWEVYYRGQGIELFTAEEAGAQNGPPIYLLDYTWGYRNEAGQIALHAYPFSFLSLELSAIYGQESNQNNVGVRPVAVFELAGFKAVAGWEYFRQFAQKNEDKVDITSQGFAGRLQYEIGPVTFGAVGSRGSIEYIDIQELLDTDRSADRTSLGGFVDIDFWRNSIGLGYHHTIRKNEQQETNTQDQAFVSYLFRLPIDRLSVKLVYGFARAHIEDIDTGSDWSNNLHSVRVRALYELF